MFKIRLEIYKVKLENREYICFTLSNKIGVDRDFAGFHCSWCSTPEGISVKLRSAGHHDFPRWGDYPEKLNLSYISGLVKNGEVNQKIMFHSISVIKHFLGPEHVSALRNCNIK